MNKGDAIKYLKSAMKSHGYKTQGKYWWKEGEDVVLFCGVQGSQWDKDDYYFNIGIMKKSHVTKSCHPDYEWDLWARYPEKDMQPDAHDIVPFVLNIHNKMDSIEKINVFLTEKKEGEIYITNPTYMVVYLRWYK